MKKIIGPIVFVIIAVALIAGGVWYNKRSDEQAVRDQARQAEEQKVAQDKQIKDLQNIMKTEDVVQGTGVEAKLGDTVEVNYVGTFADGKKFDSSYDHGQTFSFVLGVGTVIKGWDVGLIGMKEGGKRKLTIPPELGYGSQGQGPIPANATLYFTVELVKVT